MMNAQEIKLGLIRPMFDVLKREEARAEVEGDSERLDIVLEVLDEIAAGQTAALKMVALDSEISLDNS